MWTTLKHKYMNNFNYDHFPSGKWKRILFLMKLKLVVLLCSVGVISASPSYSQQKKFDVSYRNKSLVSVLDDLKSKTGYQFVYFKSAVPQQATVTMTRSDATIYQVLDEVLVGNGLSYNIVGDMVVISGLEAQSEQQPQATTTVRGIVRNAGGTPIVGATVVVRGTTTGTATDSDGSFTLNIPTSLSNAALVVSFVGMETVEVPYTGQQTVNITLKERAEAIETVVVTGMFERRKESYTGAEMTFTQDELRKVGNTNVLQSIRNLDPSFRFEDNLIDGSNPNVMPEIRLRGQSGFPDLGDTYNSDPNAPYFIVDGFESSLTAVMDMDMNRIASVTLLKDAAAKAIYGSKAANGVVVIETVKPKAGELRLSYTGSMTVQIPDLGSYNLTNAAEKLQVEKNGGVFDYKRYQDWEGSDANMQYLYDASYYALQNEVARGVNTDWLAQPTRVGIGHKHSLFLEGGDDAFQYGIDLSYNNVAGVMKKSNRDTFSGGIKLTYRYKSLSFRNNLMITYNKGTESPYGEFSEYADANPYLRTHDKYGQMAPRPTDLIENWNLKDQYSPLYNASLNSKNYKEYTQIQNNFYVEWTPADGLKLIGRASISKKNDASHLFIPAKNTKFLEYTSEEQLKRKGQYTVNDGNEVDLTGDVGAQYSRVFGERHMLFANVNWNISDKHFNSHGMMVEGFPDNDKMDDVAFASGYEKDGSPKSTEKPMRDMGVVGALNYSYDDRYLFDASIRIQGSSQFGSENRWGKFWSLGAGWNLHHENFMENVAWLNQLKLRASLGYTGSQDFKPYQSLATFQYFPDNFYNGRGGAYLMAMANPQLKWQRKMDKNIGLDVVLLDNRLSARFDYYVGDTKDLLTQMTIPSSTGSTSYMANLGNARNKGYEATVRYRVWDKPDKRASLSLFASVSHNENKVVNISESLENYNKQQVDKVNIDDNKPFPDHPASEKNGYLIQYVEGHSLNGIWAVPSAGIDPTTGKEVFIDRFGGRTFVWDSRDLRECGIMEPKLSGNAGFNFDYSGFSLNVTSTWHFGGQVYNKTLLDRVENADITKNVDRRIFTDRWVNPGDKAKFKDIKNTDTTKATSRFVEDDDVFSISSVNASYDFHDTKFLKASGIERLRVLFDMAEIARFQTMTVERGTAYPFAYSFSLSLQATF